ncbi:hypothetical protein LTR85_001169 [Meristemomyces frigidus]|nr:hypothetical protein LTR85_001169 [Meristemomyces frigidus]
MAIMDRLKFWSSTHPGATYDQVTEDEQLMGKEYDEPSAQFRALQGKQRKLQRWVSILSVLLAVAVLALLLTLANVPREEGNGHGISSPVPAMPTSKVTFERNNLYASGSSEESDEAWGLLHPDGDGFIMLRNNTRQTWGLPPGKQTAPGEVYDISLFHQLHCLVNIRKHTFTLQAALGRDNWQEIYDVLLKHQEDHVFHCFDYIRQALMCAGDMTVEWPRTEPDGRRFAVDGWGITHECKSWDAIMAFMNENTVTNFY